MGRGTTPLLIVYFVTLHKGYIQIAFFHKTPKWESQNWESRNYFEHVRAMIYSLQKDLFNSVFHSPIGNDLTLDLRGFVVGTQIRNLIPNLSFDHNSCISSVNWQCMGILISTLQDISNDIMGASFGACLPFQLGFWTFKTTTQVQLPKWETILIIMYLPTQMLMHLYSIKFQEHGLITRVVCYYGVGFLFFMVRIAHWSSALAPKMNKTKWAESITSLRWSRNLTWRLFQFNKFVLNRKSKKNT